MNVVGFSHASTPFANVTIVTPTSGISRRDPTAAGLGLLSTSARVVAASLQAVTGAASAVVRAARSPASVGGCRPSFCGAVARITRPSSFISARIITDTSAVVIVGSSCLTSWYS